MRGEFDLIERYFRPLAEGSPGALGLQDDAALVAPPAGCELVATVDALIAGVHFLADDPPGDVAAKLLRVNLSDLAAMGARPLGYLLTIALPKDLDESWVAGFAEGLRQDQERFGLGLLGGDTTGTPGPIALSLAALGAVTAGRALRRSTARAGDLVFVSGCLGDAALGLRVLRGELRTLSDVHRAELVQRYRRPEPRLALGQALADEGLATAAIDVSDGLAADLGHIAETSGLAARIEAPAVPLSEAARAALALQPGLLTDVLSGGDDYELAFTVAPARDSDVAALAKRLGLPLTRVGVLSDGQGVTVADATGRPIALERTGWSHF